MFLEKLSKINCACFILLYIFILLYFVSALKDYERHKVYQVRPTNLGQINFLTKLSLEEGFDPLTFTRQINQTSNFLVEPHVQLQFEELLRTQAIQYNVAIRNVTNYLLNNGVLRQNSYRKRAAGKIDFKHYQRATDINDYLESLARKYPKMVKVQEQGKSYEGRPIKTIFISSSSDANKQIIFIDAGIHAREWMAPASALYIIHMLVEKRKKSKHLLEALNFLILPIVNPDGYEYTRTKERLWRKTRSKQDKKCWGVDGNRNYDYHWGENGTSDDPCSGIYRGPKPFSEPETRIVRDIMLELSGKAIMYVSFHAYGSYILYQWGYDASILPKNWKDIDAVAKAGADDVMKIHRKKYKYGSSSKLLYDAAGGSHDYAFAVAKIPVAVTIEVQDDGFGFDPPASKIPSVTQESWTCIKAMIEYLRRSSRGLRSFQRQRSEKHSTGARLVRTLPLAEWFLFQSYYYYTAAF